MHDPGDRRRAARGASRAALEEAAARIRSGGPPGPGALAEIAARHGVPEASLRGVVSAYAHLSDRDPALRVCRGTACVLAGAPQPGPGDGAASCLGYCHAGPAALRAGGRVVPALAPRDAALPEPGVRVAARRPVVTARLVRGDFAALAAARDDGAYRTLAAVRGMPPQEVLARVEASGERGRGGAAFPTGRKWRMAAEAPPGPRVVVANGDEGDPGSFIDRVLMERDPHAVLEGMAICAHAVGAAEGVVFVRSEYPRAAGALRTAVADARAAGLLGRAAGFDVEVLEGFGGYVCGEETALIAAIEGARPEARPRPPYPAQHGVAGHPTVVNNVETLAAVPYLVEQPEAFRALGTRDSPGTKVMCLARGFARPGMVEVEFGANLRELVDDEAGGVTGGRLRAVAMGGPMGSIVPAAELDMPICTAAMAARGVVLGHGGLVPISADADLDGLVTHWLEFMAAESCGACAPCRLGSARAVGLWARRQDAPLTALLKVIAQTSLCGFGAGIPAPVMQLLGMRGGG